MPRVNIHLAFTVIPLALSGSQPPLSCYTPFIGGSRRNLSGNSRQQVSPEFLPHLLKQARSRQGWQPGLKFRLKSADDAFG